MDIMLQKTYCFIMKLCLVFADRELRTHYIKIYVNCEENLHS